MLFIGCTRDDTATTDGKYHRGSLSRGVRASPNWKYARNTLEVNTDSSSSGDCRQNFATSPESGGQFSEHIYEAIDEQTAETMRTKHSRSNQGFSPPENYYGDHSDISQQSSSSSSYNHQQQVQELRQGQKTLSASYSRIRSPSHEFEYTWEQYRESVCDKDVSETNDTKTILDTLDGTTQQSSVSGVLWQKNSPKNWEPQLTNILQSPTENTVVLAVLEGDKVVSRIQQDDKLIQQPYKLSTFY